MNSGIILVAKRSKERRAWSAVNTDPSATGPTTAVTTSPRVKDELRSRPQAVTVPSYTPRCSPPSESRTRDETIWTRVNLPGFCGDSFRRPKGGEVQDRLSRTVDHG
jgi:hypothetical protein